MTDPKTPGTSAPRIRPAQARDAAAIAALLRGIGWFKAYERSTPEEAAAAVQAVIDNAALGARSLLLVAETADDPASAQVIGFCAVHWLPLAILQGWEAYVSELFVSEQARGSGAGRHLLDAAVGAARERGCARIWLVNNRQRMSYTRGFYAQQGWSEQPEAARFVLALDAAPSAIAPSSSPR